MEVWYEAQDGRKVKCIVDVDARAIIQVTAHFNATKQSMNCKLIKVKGDEIVPTVDREEPTLTSLLRSTKEPEGTHLNKHP